MIYEQAKHLDERAEFSGLLSLSRWVTLAFVAVGIAAQAWLALPVPKIFYVVFGFKFALIVSLLAVLPTQRNQAVFSRLRFSYYVVDALLMTAIVYALGGVEWIGFVALIFTITQSNLILPTRQGLGIVLLSAAGYGIVLLLESRGFLPHLSLFGQNVKYSGSYLAANYIGATSIYIFLGMIISRFARTLRQRTRDFKGVNDRLKILNEEVTAKNLSLTLSQKEQVVINERLKQQNDDLSKSQHVILTLATAVESKDNYTAGHSLRVAGYAVNLAKEIKLSVEEQNRIKNGSILHDVGKINISDLVLRKPGPLTEEEFAVMKGHPLTGEKICRPLHFARPYLDIIRHHHERPDGRGYPDGLKGAEISLQARIVAIADAFDAMTSNRSYRAAMTPDVACARLREYAGLQWDAELVETFVKVIKRRLASADPMAVLEHHERQFFS